MLMVISPALESILLEQISVLNPITLQTFPKQLPPKTTTQESYLKTMISKDLKGFGLYPLVEKKNPPLGRVNHI